METPIARLVMLPTPPTGETEAEFWHRIADQRSKRNADLLFDNALLRVKVETLQRELDGES